MPVARLSLRVAVILGLLTAPAGAETLRIATEGAYPPWNATEADGTLVGFEVELAGDLCRRMATECAITAQDWDGLLPGLQQGRYDAVMAGVSITEERRRAVDFSRAYAADPAVFAVPAGSPLVTAFPAGGRVDLGVDGELLRGTVAAIGAALAGRTVAVQTSTSHARMMQALFPDVAVRTYDKADHAALDLVAGRVDALLGARSAVAAIQGGPTVVVGPGFSHGVLGQGVGVAVRKGDELANRFTTAIIDAARDGTTAALTRKWFGYDASVPAP
ncbi:transporter substrate-binding domain-containing protein [Azospirillum doebereinerae]|uniref:transporter substrate-binding domain-containing protein n=1 Tax=Azospirillum doebereinerae TaxID=92933 RepID=UPI001EE557F0|nr:transporter substrate-binding domain-containing protein [Azospirillum doebereinerae]MCG5238382.1 transporter substrate-binding domain-containing protein [Azospirillum doebereinerae]